MPALADALLTILDRLWPARAKQELLLDLGERKDWSAEDRGAAVSRFADWLTANVAMPGTLAAEDGDTETDGDRPDVPVDGVEPERGVGRGVVALARLVGTPAKTLANTLATPLRADRRDHRWLLLLRQLERGEAETDALVFHRRSPASVAGAIARAASRRAPDAGDALLLLSLVALWQRRRDTHEARAARGVSGPRGAMPKPAAAVKWDVVALPQLAPLIELAIHRGGEFGRDLAAIAVEAVLTEAHLAPHRTRGVQPPDATWGVAWLRGADDVLSDPRVAALLGERETAIFRWRVARMRDYAAGNRALAVPLGCQRHPYVDLALAIDAARGGGVSARRFRAREPGYFMLLPQARRRGLIEDA